LTLQPIPWGELDTGPVGESSETVRKRVIGARRRQLRRGASPGDGINADIPDNRVDSVVRATPEARRLLGRAVESLGLSARGARRTLKVARTIADLAGEEETGPTAMAEALSYRGNTADLHLKV